MSFGSRAALRLARWVLPPPVAESIAGDLEEERSRARRSSVWFLSQMFAVSIYLWWNEQFQSRHRQKGDGMLETLRYDIRLACRSLTANSRFAVVALLTIGLTVGGITAVFSLVNSIVLRPLPYEESDRLVNITAKERNGRVARVTAADFLEIQRDARSYEILAAARNTIITFDEDTDNPTVLLLWSVHPTYFQLLGIRPVLGRGLVAADAAPESTLPGVLGYDVWQSRYGGDPGIIGKVISLPAQGSGQKQVIQVAVVGVMPPTFKAPQDNRLPSVWTPLRSLSDPTQRMARLTVLGRLRTDVPVQSAQAELAGISTRLAAASADASGRPALQVALVLDEIVGDMKQTLWIFFGAVAFVLLIGIVNLTNLQIVRNSARERDLAIRAALGAGRGRLVRQLVLETLLLSTAGGALGLVAAIAGTNILLQAGPVRFPRADQIAADAAVYLFALGVSVMAGLLFGAIPAWRISRPNLHETVNEGRTATMSSRRSWTQQFLIGAETALALVLLVGAGLLTNSLWRLFTEDAGLQEDNLWSVHVQLPRSYRTFDQTSGVWAKALDRFRALPEVESAAVAVNAPAPLEGSDMSLGGLVPEGSPGGSANGYTISLRFISTEYFKTIGVPLLRGRSILDSDTSASETVAVLNESGARLLWPNGDALGRRVTWRSGSFTITGIVRDFQHRDLGGEVVPQMFVPYVQGPGPFGHSNATLLVKLRPNVQNRAANFAGVITDLESRAQIRILSMKDIRWTAVTMEKFRTSVLLMFAAVAMFLAMAGIFGVVSYAVTQREREIGLRIALGARPANVANLVMRQAMLPGIVGMAAGLAGSFGLTQFLSAYLFEVTPTDPRTFLVAALLLMASALAAAFIPARKACRIDPMSALRHE